MKDYYNTKTRYGNTLNTPVLSCVPRFNHKGEIASFQWQAPTLLAKELKLPNMFSFTQRVGDSLFETVQQGIRLRNLHRDGKNEEINEIIKEDARIPKPKRPVFSLNSDEGIAYYRLRDEHLKLNQQMFSAPLDTCIWRAVSYYQIFSLISHIDD